MGDEGWYIVEDAGGILNGTTLHGKRAWALMALEIASPLRADGVTAFESEIWEPMNTNPDEYEVPLMELVHVAVDHMERASSRGTIDK